MCGCAGGAAPFIAPPSVSGDPASLVIEVEWLGSQPVLDTINHYFHTNIKGKYS